MTEILLWAGYFAVFAFLVHRGRSKDAVLSGSVGFGVQAFAYVATYISAVALVGFGGLAHAYGLQMLLVAAGNVWFGTWAVYRFLAWPTRKWQERLGARTPAQLLGLGHGSPSLTRAMAFVFALFLGVYGSAVIKGAALLLAEILPMPVWALIWLVAIIVGLTVFIGGLRGVLYTEAMQGVVMLVGMLMLMTVSILVMVMIMVVTMVAVAVLVRMVMIMAMFIIVITVMMLVVMTMIVVVPVVMMVLVRMVVMMLMVMHVGALIIMVVMMLMVLPACALLVMIWMMLK